MEPEGSLWLTDSALTELQDLLPRMPQQAWGAYTLVREWAAERTWKDAYIAQLVPVVDASGRASILASRVRDDQLRSTIVASINRATPGFSIEETAEMVRSGTPPPDEWARAWRRQAHEAVEAASQAIGASLRSPGRE
jgi:hypothetical protein